MASESQLLLFLGLVMLGILILLILLVYMIFRRLRKSQTQQTGLQSRLEDITQPNNPAASSMSSPGEAIGSPLEQTAATSTLTPIEQKLMAVEQAEAEVAMAEEGATTPSSTEDNFGKQDVAGNEYMTSEEAWPMASVEEDDSLSADIFADLELEEETRVDDLWEDLNIEFEKEGEMPFLMGEVSQEESAAEIASPDPPLTVLSDIEARTFLEQLNQYRLSNRGQITETEQECSLSWQSAMGNHEILVTVQDAETLNINGETFPATPDGVKQGIIAALNNDNY